MSTSTCSRLRCNTVTPGAVATCPACGAKTITARRVRTLGWLLLVIGLFLIGLMGTITLRMLPSMSHPGVADMSGTTFTGSPDQARQALQLFAGVIAFGVLAAVNGLWQIVTGRRSLVFAGLTIAVALALFLAARGMLPPGTLPV